MRSGQPGFRGPRRSGLGMGRSALSHMPVFAFAFSSWSAPDAFAKGVPFLSLQLLAAEPLAGVIPGWSRSCQDRSGSFLSFQQLHRRRQAVDCSALGRWNVHEDQDVVQPSSLGLRDGTGNVAGSGPLS